MRRSLASTWRWAFALSSFAVACQGDTENIGSTSSGKDDGSPVDVANATTDTPEDAEVAEAGDGGSESQDPGRQEVASDADSIELLIPLEPRDESALSFLVLEDPMTGDLVPSPDSLVRLAFGEGYPDRMSFALNSMLVPVGSAPVVATELVLASAIPVGAGNGIEAIVLDDDQLQLQVHQAGTHVVRLELTAEFGEAAPSTTYAFSVTVDARQVTGAEWSTCTGPLYFVSGSPPAASRLYPLDERGMVFAPLNTSFDRGADIIVRALAGTRIEAPAGLDSLVVTGPSQTVQIRSNYGEVTTFQLIQPGEIDSISPTFHSDRGGARGGGTSLRSGGEVTVDLTRSPYISVFPGARFGGEGVCGGPDPALFHLRSTTPEVCVIEPDGCAVRGCNTDGYVPAVAAMVAAGTCNLELAAPTLDHGDGLSASFSVDIKAL